MGQDERDFILKSAKRVEEWENTPRTFEDPYSDMSSEEKSKLIIHQASIIQDLTNDKEKLTAKIDRLTSTVEEFGVTARSLNSLINSLQNQLDNCDQKYQEAKNKNETLLKEIQELKGANEKNIR